MRHKVLLYFTVACVLGVRLPAQILKLSGQVTSVFGVYSNLFSVGDPVTFVMDFSPPLIDEIHGAGLQFQTVLYSVPATLVIGNTEMFLLNGKTDPFILRQPTRDGIYINSAWEGFGDTPFGEVFQDFYSSHTILPSYSYFPPNIPIDEFASTVGMYGNHNFAPTGSVSWTISSYTGYGGSPPFVPVPESPLLGVTGIGILILAGLFRARLASSRLARN